MEHALQILQKVLHSLCERDRIMNAFNSSKTMVAAVAAAIALSSAAVSAAETYGRAGGAVGSDRVEQVAKVTTTAPQTADLNNAYGRAGGVIGVERVARVSKAKTYAAGQQTKTPVVYGRAGYAQPFGG
jgi:hypothetical protein